MKPFLLLGTRELDAAADAEYDSVLRHTGLSRAELRHVRLEAAPLAKLQVEDYSGIVLGGGPFNVSDIDKSDTQVRVESDLAGLLEQIIEAEFPFLGLCYGVGVLARYLGGVVDRTFTEPVSAVTVTVTAEGRADPLLAGIPDTFRAFTAHKEACRVLPAQATVLATGDVAPYQLFRVGTSAYVTQFHPELDADELVARMGCYRDAGYFDPDELEILGAQARASRVDGSQHAILRNFATLFGR